ncbi:MAG: phosphatidylserine/phosphatidylglycerophosphate/cardiolipin synthase family protein [Planctomycetes bacterium]|nr:phosphatidylserine/phosphatidylglycerophosphate/cardiolipin synthase family protein [Planctomycetota bacterium]
MRNQTLNGALCLLAVFALSPSLEAAPIQEGTFTARGTFATSATKRTATRLTLQFRRLTADTFEVTRTEAKTGVWLGRGKVLGQSLVVQFRRRRGIAASLRSSASASRSATTRAVFSFSSQEVVYARYYPGTRSQKLIGFEKGRRARGGEAKLGVRRSKLFQIVIQAANSAPLPGTTADQRALVTVNNWAGVEVLIEPERIYKKYAELIEGAEHDVALQTFAWDKDSQPVDEVFRGLQRLQERRRQAGATRAVKVRILIDTMTSGMNMNTKTQDIFLELRIMRSEYKLDPQFVDLRVGAYDHKLLGSMHSKSLVVDGRVAVLTGANMNKNDNWDTGEHDAGFVLGGAVALSLLADFDDAWLKSRVWKAGDFGYGNRWMRALPMAEATRIPSRVVHRIAPPRPSERQIPMMVVGKQARDGLFPTRKTGHPLNRTYLALLDNAKREIHIQTPNLNEREIKAALVAAVRRGVRVKMVLSKGYEKFAESMPYQGGTNQENVEDLYERLARAGVDSPKSRLQIRWYRHGSASRGPVEGNSAKANHVKYLAVDGQITLVTSLNNDTQSWRSSREIGVVIDDVATTRRWGRQLFTPDFRNGVQVD